MEKLMNIFNSPMNNYKSLYKPSSNQTRQYKSSLINTQTF